jgi:hypothetical protein
MDHSVHPPIVGRLHYEFYRWLRAVLLESCQCFIVTESAKRKLQSVGLTGIRFDKVEVNTSELFHQIYPNRQLPKFVWL